MPLIKPRTHRVRVVRHICRLQEPNRDALVRYARFIGDTPDYVLNQLVETTLVKDKDFVAWQAEHASEPGPTTADASEPNERRAESVLAAAPAPVTPSTPVSTTVASASRSPGVLSASTR